jgi:RNA polymerase sigma-70 factor, ECF subfamily
MSGPSSQEITGLLQAWNQGDQQALERLTPLVYQELHRMARRCISRGRREQTLQATALVNELYLKVVDLKAIDWQNRAHFLAICARQMRWILTDFYRSGQYLKRGGGAERIALDESALMLPEASRDLLAIDDAPPVGTCRHQLVSPPQLPIFLIAPRGVCNVPSLLTLKGYG